ncbi:MAG: helix-turn-helix domain-containing protein [Niveispirillum sp.]|uniref:helix-turn-helix domain-containing protein n=1 Tax=Niveispirillum sp. TaxID=1917217 RepID=UPI003BA58316
MNAIKPIRVTEDTVTLAKADFEALLDAVEEARDLERVREIEADLAAGRTETMPLEMALALCDGANPVRIWRKHRGLTARALSASVGITPGYLSEIESGKKAGSLAVMARIAGVLRVELGDLVAGHAE